MFAGGIIPDRDRSDLHKSGVRAVFGPGTPTSDILNLASVAAYSSGVINNKKPN